MAAVGEEAELVLVIELGKADGAVRGGFLKSGGDGVEGEDGEGVNEGLVFGGHMAVEDRWRMAVIGRRGGGGGSRWVADAVEEAKEEVDGG